MRENAHSRSQAHKHVELNGSAINLLLASLRNALGICRWMGFKGRGLDLMEEMTIAHVHPLLHWFTKREHKNHMKCPDESMSMIRYNCGSSGFSSLLICMLLMSNLRGKFGIPPQSKWYFTGIRHTRFCFKRLGSNSRLLGAYASSRNLFGSQWYVVGI